MNSDKIAEKIAQDLLSADTFKCPDCGTKVLEKTGFCIKCKKKVKSAHDLVSADDLDKLNDKLLKAMKVADDDWKDYQDYLTRADKPFNKMNKSTIALGNILSDIGGKYKDSVKLEKNVNTSKEIIETANSFKDPSSFQ
jgi:DNA-directed RNA polymerase subunit RPC12/RpoP